MEAIPELVAERDRRSANICQTRHLQRCRVVIFQRSGRVQDEAVGGTAAAEPRGRVFKNRYRTGGRERQGSEPDRVVRLITQIDRGTREVGMICHGERRTGGVAECRGGA